MQAALVRLRNALGEMTGRRAFHNYTKRSVYRKGKLQSRRGARSGGTNTTGIPPLSCVPRVHWGACVRVPDTSSYCRVIAFAEARKLFATGQRSSRDLSFTEAEEETSLSDEESSGLHEASQQAGVHVRPVSRPDSADEDDEEEEEETERDAAEEGGSSGRRRNRIELVWHEEQADGDKIGDAHFRRGELLSSDLLRLGTRNFGGVSCCQGDCGGCIVPDTCPTRESVSWRCAKCHSLSSTPLWTAEG